MIQITPPTPTSNRWRHHLDAQQMHDLLERSGLCMERGVTPAQADEIAAEMLWPDVFNSGNAKK